MNKLIISKFHIFAKQNQLPENEFFWLKMANLFALVGLWGEKINLTANTDVDKFLYANIADPLYAYYAFKRSKILKFGEAKSLELVDLGCGGGFVGLVWHLASEGIFKTLLVDSDRRKINFCKQVIRELKLENIFALQKRAEEMQTQRGNSPDVIISRATWNFEKFALISRKLCSPQTKIIYFSGKKIADSDMKNKISAIDYKIPGQGIQRQLWCYGGLQAPCMAIRGASRGRT